MSSWAYVAIAYTVVWGGLAAYALVLARRVYQAREVSRTLREALDDERPGDKDGAVCDGQPAP